MGWASSLPGRDVVVAAIHLLMVGSGRHGGDEHALLVLGQCEFNGILDTVPALSRKLLSAMATRLRSRRKGVQLIAGVRARV
jgi:hypothetical protein